jgi:hypothetical protein
MEHIVKNDEQFAPNCKCGAGRMFQGLFNYVFSSSPLEKEPDILGRESKGDLFYVIRFSALKKKLGVNSSGEQKWIGEKEFVSLYFFDTIDLQFTPRCKRWAVWRSPYNSTTGTFFQSI